MNTSAHQWILTTNCCGLLWALVMEENGRFSDDLCQYVLKPKPTQEEHHEHVGASVELLQSSVSVITTQFETENKVNNNIETILTT
jgi:hypothetical protein